MWCFLVPDCPTSKPGEGPGEDLNEGLLLEDFHWSHGAEICKRHRRGWFSSTDLCVMDPARFCCNTVLSTIPDGTQTHHHWIIDHSWRSPRANDCSEAPTGSAWLPLPAWMYGSNIPLVDFFIWLVQLESFFCGIFPRWMNKKMQMK